MSLKWLLHPLLSPNLQWNRRDKVLKLVGKVEWAKGAIYHCEIWVPASVKTASGFIDSLRQSSLYWALKWKPGVESQLSQEGLFPPSLQWVADGRWFPGLPKEGFHFVRWILYWMKNKPLSVGKVLHSRKKKKSLVGTSHVLMKHCWQFPYFIVYFRFSR